MTNSNSDLPIYTLDSIQGYRIKEVKGLVRGNTIRARNVFRDIIAALRTLIGGEVTEYTKMMAESREQALDRMKNEAMTTGANAVIGLRMTTSMVMQGTAEILAYGTAVILEKE
jgi:uncharacterized protein YbjQ (UPF0145 family)